MLGCLFGTSACSEEDETENYISQDELIVFYPIEGVGDRGYVDAIYRSMEEIALAHNLKIRHLIPHVDSNGLEVMQLFKKHEEDHRCLIVFTDPAQETVIEDCASIYTEDRNNQVLYLETRKKIPNIHTMYLPFYGANFAAGRMAQVMEDVNRVSVLCANPTLEVLQESAQGFDEGFDAADGQVLVVNYIDSIGGGFDIANQLYQSAYILNKKYDLVHPLCGGSVYGLLRFNREFPQSFYTVGMDIDLSDYSSRVPFSCVKHIGEALKYCVELWENNALPDHLSLGLEEGYTDLVIAPAYRSLLDAQLDPIKAEAIEKEKAYELLKSNK